MRTDILIDKKQVKCPNVSLLGYGKWKAQVGDLVWFKEGDTERIGRMVGRVASGDHKNHIIVGTLSSSLCSVYERWVSPNQVTRIEEIRNQGEALAWFLSDTMTKAPMDKVRHCIHNGWSSFDAYMEWRKGAGLE